MQRIQLYIEDNNGNYPLVDMFDNETVQLTSSIQDIRDIGKVFTDFSMPFTVPASETNNKIFRHFYNYNITGNAFDARKKRKAKIHINYAPFREGKIFLNSVKMRNNKAYAYEIIFYGNTVSLKDLLGDDELIDLAVNRNDQTARYLSNYNHEYNETNVRSGLVDGIDFLVDGTVQENAIIYPLITSKKRLYYDSSTMTSTDADGNLYHDASNPDQTRGLEFTDLKPAIKVIHIIEAIEDTYRDSDNNKLIEFTRDFFEAEDSPINNLYLWINNKKGEFNDIDDDQRFLFSYFVKGYTEEFGNQKVYPQEITITGSEISIDITPLYRYRFDCDVTVSDQNVEYEITLRNKTTGQEQTESFVGDGVFTSEIIDPSFSTLFPDGFDDNTVLTYKYEIEIRSKESITINSADVDIDRSFNLLPFDPYQYNTSTSQDTQHDLFLKDRLPDMKVIDFLTGLFKMFNLTAYYIDEPADVNVGKIYVDTLDNFYSSAVNNKLGGLIEIEKYVDASEHTVSSVLPFTDISFQYEETNTVLMEHHYEEFGEVFGNSEFNVKRKYPDIDRGKKYEIKLPFSHFKYERLLDLNVAASDRETLIQWGYCAGGDYNFSDSTSPPKGDYDTMFIKPLLFYGLRTSSSTTKINWISTSTPTGLTNYYKPSNANTVATSFQAPEYSLNFDQEFNEWERINYGAESNSLYNVFYKTYVESVFNPLKRMFKIKAFLPPNIIINYRLNDQIKIRDKIFRINSITTNLMTGESELELLNIFSNEIVQ